MAGSSHLCHVIKDNTKLWGNTKHHTTRVFSLYVNTLSSNRSSILLMLIQKDISVMTDNLIIQVFWDVTMCGRFRSPGIWHCVTGLTSPQQRNPGSLKSCTYSPSMGKQFRHFKRASSSGPLVGLLYSADEGTTNPLKDQRPLTQRQCNDPEDSNLSQHSCKNIKSCNKAALPKSPKRYWVEFAARSMGPDFSLFSLR
jgi:hypothetical protein